MQTPFHLEISQINAEERAPSASRDSVPRDRFADATKTQL